MIKKAICILLVLTIALLAACSGSEYEETEQDKIIRAVKTRARLQGMSATIGGNDIKTTSADITNISYTSDLKCTVSGRIFMTDIYGTKWRNTFDCVVISSDGENWSVSGELKFKSSSWSKSN